MPIETLDDIVEALADIIGIWGTGDEILNETMQGHPETCECRNCFCLGLKDRIRKAAKIEERLNA